jgi:hypothetical protein
MPRQPTRSIGSAEQLTLAGIVDRPKEVPSYSGRAKLVDVARFYRRTRRQVQHWRAVGRAHGQRCPVFEPGLMPTWWRRNMTWRVPRDIHDAAGRRPPWVIECSGKVPKSLKSIDDAVIFYQRGRRTISRWWALGRKRKALCPIFEPRKMKTWWKKHMKSPCPF